MSTANPSINPATIVIFGASGDLTQRKLVPALHSLTCRGLLPQAARVIGVARTQLSDAAFRDRLYTGVGPYETQLEQEMETACELRLCEQWSKFVGRYSYLPGGYGDADTYRRLAEQLAQSTADLGATGNALFYLATPPSLYPKIIEQLGQARLNRSAAGWRRVIIEKPFGHDLESARKLNEHVHRVFDEEQVYRIDHYLGKETVQNILTLRFANAIFEPLWNQKYVDHVQITVAESLGVGHRAGYYDQAGVLRDMFQNHLLQLLTLTAMEPPAMFEANGLRDEKVKTLRAIDPAAVRSVRGQYRGYRDELGVDPESQTPTYAALRLGVNNWRWAGVPFYLRSGKSMAAKASEIAVQFRRVPHLMFPTPPGKHITPNILSLCIQPDEGIHLHFEAKEPGAGMQTRSVDMEFHYAEDFGPSALPDAYERLLLDAMQGDASLFARSDEIELAWRVIDPILESWERPDAAPLALYEPGSWGPVEADDFVARDDRAWHYGCGQHGGTANS
jgi:glucose-6-phosphate 1-dehydrogenase